MTERIKLVQGDNLPYIKLGLTNADGTALDVSDGTVTVHFRAAGTTDTLSILTCANVNDGTDGLVQFNFPGTTLDVPEGQYEGEITIDFTGLVQTVYSVLKFTVRADFE